MRRRALLSAATATIASSVTGCLGETPSAAGPPSQTSTESSTETSSPTYTQSKPSSKPVRCRGEPTTAEGSVTDEPGYEDDMKYFPSNETVRVVTLRNSEGPAGFSTWSFEEWGKIECSEVGVERVRNVTADRLGTDEFGSSIGQPPGFFSADASVIWVEVTTQTEDGETVSTPTVPLARLADVAPRSVDVTVSLEGDTFSRTIPVFAEHVAISPT